MYNIVVIYILIEIENFRIMMNILYISQDIHNNTKLYIYLNPFLSRSW